MGINKENSPEEVVAQAEHHRHSGCELAALIERRHAR